MRSEVWNRFALLDGGGAVPSDTRRTGGSAGQVDTGKIHENSVGLTDYPCRGRGISHDYGRLDLVDFGQGDGR